jgi:hypothetical protein
MQQHQPTDEQRKLVKAMSAYGVPQLEICKVISIDPKTLRLHYERELDTATAEANSQVAQSLFSNATKFNNVTAQIFWLKTRGRWKEVAQEVQLTGADGGPIKSVTAQANVTDPVEAAKLYAKLMSGDE